MLLGCDCACDDDDDGEDDEDDDDVLALLFECLGFLRSDCEEDDEDEEAVRSTAICLLAALLLLLLLLLLLGVVELFALLFVPLLAIPNDRGDFFNDLPLVMGDLGGVRGLFFEFGLLLVGFEEDDEEEAEELDATEEPEEPEEPVEEELEDVGLGKYSCWPGTCSPANRLLPPHALLEAISSRISLSNCPPLPIGTMSCWLSVVAPSSSSSSSSLETSSSSEDEAALSDSEDPEENPDTDGTITSPKSMSIGNGDGVGGITMEGAAKS